MLNDSRSRGFKFNRRSLLIASAGFSLAALTNGVLAEDGTPAADGLQTDGSWSFTDDRGVTVKLSGMPQRVVADVNVAGALWDFGVHPIGIFGWNITGPDSVNAAGGDLDTKAVQFLNDAGTTIDVERAAAIDPDLIVSLFFGEKYGVWSVDPAVQSRLEQIAPIVALSGLVRADVSLERTAGLAAALGADLASAELAGQRTTYETAWKRFTDAVAAKSGISAVFIAPSADTIYVASPDAAGDVMLYRDLGLAVPTLPVAAGEYWESLSMEQALKYPTDMLFYSLRGDITSLDAFRAHPTFSKHPAVIAGQVFPWNQDFISNYPGLTTMLDATAEAVEASDPSVGS